MTKSVECINRRSSKLARLLNHMHVAAQNCAFEASLPNVGEPVTPQHFATFCMLQARLEQQHVSLGIMMIAMHHPHSVRGLRTICCSCSAVARWYWTLARSGTHARRPTHFVLATT